MRQYYKRTFWAILLLLTSHSGFAQSVTQNPAYSSARGPIAIRNQRPYNLLFLQFTPESADILPARADRYVFQLDIANNLLIPAAGSGSKVIEDNETQRLHLDWRHGLGHGTEFAVFLPVVWRNGGVLDDILSFYHRISGLPGNAEDNPAGRNNLPKYQSILSIVDSNGKTLLNRGNAFGLGEVSLTIKHALIRETRRYALAFRAGIKLPTGNPTLVLGSGGLDAGLSLDARYSVGREVSFYLNLGGVLTGRSRKIPNREPGLMQVFAGMEYRPNNRDSYLFQFDGGNPTVRTGNSFADRANVTATFGYKRVLDRHLVLSASFSENGDIHNYSLPGFSNIGPDFTLSAGVEWHR